MKGVSAALPIGPSVSDVKSWARRYDTMGIHDIVVPDHIFGGNPEHHTSGWHRDFSTNIEPASSRDTPFNEPSTLLAFLAGSCGLAHGPRASSAARIVTRSLKGLPHSGICGRRNLVDPRRTAWEPAGSALDPLTTSELRGVA